MTPQTELRQFLDNIAATSAKIFLEEGELFPRAVLLAPAPDGPENAVALVMVPLSLLPKEHWSAGIKQAIEKTNAFMIVFAVEAWTLEMKGDKAKFDELTKDGIAHLPGRKECLTFTAEDRHGNSLIAHQIITRDADGKPSLGELAPMIQGEGPAHYEGRFVSFMPPVGKPQ